MDPTRTIPPRTRRRSTSDASPLEVPRLCQWCRGVISLQARRDSKFCSVRCRQRSHGFAIRRCELAAATSRPCRFAYADPPYPGKAFYYRERAEVDHVALVGELVRNFPDGRALSTSSRALRDVLLLCPPTVRVCAWFKGARGARSYRALVSWEPLIVAGGRALRVDVVQDLRDGLIAQGRHRAFPGALVGMKPPAFAEWMFRQLGARAGDELVDLFPGSGAVGVAWDRYTSSEYSGDASPSPAGDASHGAGATAEAIG